MTDRVLQPRLFNPDDYGMKGFPAVPAVSEAARSYSATQGLKWEAPSKHVAVNPQRGHEQYLAYRNAQRSPQEAPGIRRSYEVMREHVGKQFEHLTRPQEKGGMGFTFEAVDADPYDSPEALAQDVANRRIKVMKTATTGGHNFFTNEENDQFRAVHDVFGHVGIGRDFSRHGEEAAFLSHRQMFPKEAHAALASETRGQNSFLNYGPEGDFPDQGPGTKLIGLPSWVEGDTMPKAKKPKQPKYEQGRLF
jgi:hypothetical protein